MNLSEKVLKAQAPELRGIVQGERGGAYCYSPEGRYAFDATSWDDVGQLSDLHKISTEYNDIPGMWYASNGDEGVWHEDQKTAICLCFLAIADSKE